MTLWYPDVSNHEGAMSLEAATVAVCTKASEGGGYADPYYAHYKAEAARVGAVFFAYHFLHAGSGAAQARWCFEQTGPGVNVMVDCEPTGASDPSVQDCVDFARAYRALGGLCTLVYLPNWYWQQLGQPTLAPLAGVGLHLVSSAYTTYSDTGPGWIGYGGVAPAVWQYADSVTYSGQPVDFNAYRGTIDQFKALLGYSAPPTPAPAAPQPEETDMLIIRTKGAAPVYGLSGGLFWHIADPADLQQYINAGVKQVTVDAAEIAAIQTAAGQKPAA